MKLYERTIDTERIYEGKILNLRKDTVLLENGSQATREVIEHNGAVCIVAVDKDDKIYFVKQFRHPFQRVMLEVPAGKIDKGESPIDAAHRELEEEIGMKATEIIPMGEFYPSVAYLTEVIYMYIAKGLIPSQQHLDDDEFLKIEKMTLGQACDLIYTNEIKDGKTIAAILKASQLL
ncbi:NUDIX hydrolase [Paludicola sp. MB14-C6]|uniref:NUDIX domain-containing protein n=1 Tax=Paludihabitans sp. MB14-C6 TaxID=3070656 RepID=UPI0027DE8C60|nr:NUDIX hydrolase [Paludicola sp. MB14-C6]WMJ24199.1 NUDIX hydrolase [Paludicola sp. MB14-C6]